MCQPLSLLLCVYVCMHMRKYISICVYVTQLLELLRNAVEAVRQGESVVLFEEEEDDVGTLS